MISSILGVHKHVKIDVWLICWVTHNYPIEEVKNISTEIIKANTFSNKYADYVKIRNEIREKVGSYLYKETQSKPVILTVIQEV